MSKGSVLVQIEVRLCGERADLERAANLLRRGVEKWANAQPGVVGKPIVRTSPQPYTEPAPEPADPDEIFGEEAK